MISESAFGVKHTIRKYSKVYGVNRVANAEIDAEKKAHRDKKVIKLKKLQKLPDTELITTKRKKK
jgi:hypothetical protein